MDNLGTYSEKNKNNNSAFIRIWYQTIKDSTTLKVGKLLGISPRVNYIFSISSYPANHCPTMPKWPHDQIPYWAVQSYFIMLEFEHWNEVFKKWKWDEAASGLDPYSGPILVRSCENLWSETMSALSKVWWASSFFVTKETFLIPRSMKKVLISQLCPTIWGPMDYSSPGSSVHGILQARIPEWVAMTISRRSSWSRGRTWVCHIAGRFFTVWATREALNGSFIECLLCVKQLTCFI